MRIKLIAVAAVLAMSIALCLFSMHQVFAALDQMEYQTALLLERIDAGDLEGGRQVLAEMAHQWEEAKPLLEALTPHGDLHDVTLQYVEAATNLESGDMDDFARSAALLREYLKHLREHESLSWSNLF